MKSLKLGTALRMSSAPSLPIRQGGDAKERGVAVLPTSS